MGFYQKHILPKLIDCACGMKQVTEQRGKVLPLASGRVLEIGIGSGLNLPVYDATRVTSVVGLDPGEELLTYARRRARGLPFPVELLTLGAEAIEFNAASVGTVVVTYTLCTIPDVSASVAHQAAALAHRLPARRPRRERGRCAPAYRARMRGLPAHGRQYPGGRLRGERLPCRLRQPPQVLRQCAPCQEGSEVDGPRAPGG